LTWKKIILVQLERKTYLLILINLVQEMVVFRYSYTKNEYLLVISIVILDIHIRRMNIYWLGNRIVVLNKRENISYLSFNIIVEIIKCVSYKLFDSMKLVFVFLNIIQHRKREQHKEQNIVIKGKIHWGHK